MIRKTSSVVLTSALLFSLAACGIGNDHVAYDPSNDGRAGTIPVRNDVNNNRGFFERNLEDGNNFFDNVVNDNQFQGRNRTNRGNDNVDISASNTNINSDKYPHTRAVLIQDAKYSFTSANGTDIASIQKQLEEQLKARFGQLTPQLRQQAKQQAQQQVQKQPAQQQPTQQQPAQQQPAQQQQQPAEQPKKQEQTQAQTGNISEFAQQVIDLTNQERSKGGLAALKADTQLSGVALKKSQDMQANNYFSHTSPTYGSPFDMMRDFGVTYKSAGENIAQGQRTPQEVVQAWMNSEGHRKNIMNGDFTHIGVGYEQNGNHWTQMFVGR
ncbi:CAP domain-containing protein [Robertmurraya massiliosenegalensis]|uniref:CAP domain-containing protein n=1 Tax=Robertmurraya TaxID=2837507 RepID=UPI0039A4318A